MNLVAAKFILAFAIVIALSCSSTQSAVAQTRECNITGIGIFKLGALGADILPEVRRVTGSTTPIPTVSVQEEFDRLKQSPTAMLILIQADSNGHNIPEATVCPASAVYWITRYEIEGLMLRDIKLILLDDTLFHFQSESTPELEKILTAQYGEPEVEGEEEPSSECKQKRMNTSTTAYWKNGPILASSYLRTRYDADCKPTQHNRFYVLRNDSITKRMLACERETMDIIYEKREEERRKYMEEMGE